MRQFPFSPSRVATGQPPSRKEDTGSTSTKVEGYQVKSGKLLLQHRLGSRTTWLPVHVRVYRNAFEHFAVVSRDQVISLCSTYINLRTSVCRQSADGPVTRFTVVQNNYEGTVICFDAGDKERVSEWMEAFTSTTPPCSPTQGGMSATLSPAIPRGPIMPPLPEEDEEE